MNSDEERGVTDGGTCDGMIPDRFGEIEEVVGVGENLGLGDDGDSDAIATELTNGVDGPYLGILRMERDYEDRNISPRDIAEFHGSVTGCGIAERNVSSSGIRSNIIIVLFIL